MVFSQTPKASATTRCVLSGRRHTRLANVEVLAVEQKPTVMSFLSRAVAWFNSQGIACQRVMSDKGPACVSNQFANACQALQLRNIRTRPYTPSTNGKADRLIQTLCREWA